MLKYDNIANLVINVNLHNNYSIIAFAKWEFKTEKYSVSLYIKENTIDHFDSLDDYKNIIFDSDIKAIKQDIAKYIEALYNEGKITRYIKRCEYELKCFDKGDDFLSNSKEV